MRQAVGRPGSLPRLVLRPAFAANTAAVPSLLSLVVDLPLLSAQTLLIAPSLIHSESPRSGSVDQGLHLIIHKRRY